MLRACSTLTLALCCTTSLLAAPPRPSDEAQLPLNVVVVLLDNTGQEWLGCYGSEEGRTPRLDALAAAGVRCEHCYTPPVCGPSRIVLLSGRYLLRSGMTLHHDAALYGGGGFSPDHEIIFPRLFHAAGYRTAVAGKWQINNLYDEPDVLTRHGFDEHLVWPGSVDRDRTNPQERERFQKAILARDIPQTVAAIQKVESRYWDPVVLRNGKREVLTGRYGPDVFQEFALDFLERHRDRPFLLYYPMVLAHGQTFTKPVVPTPTNRNADRPHEEIYGEMVAYADRLLGELIDKLAALGLRERTLVVVATDNGTESGLKARFRGRTAQGGLYQLSEAGGDVGLLFHAPGRIVGGRTVPLADFSDVLPTVCDAAGVAVPRELTLDGRSLAPYLLGQTSAPPRKWIFNQYGPRRVVRDERYKLYSTGELFEIAVDREESRNLAGDSSPEVSRALAFLQERLAAMPPDQPPPFELRSQTAFKLFHERRAQSGK